MSAIPANLTRVPNLLSSQLLYNNITRTNLGLFGVQNQLATGQRVNRFSDDAIAATSISLIQDRLARTDQRLKNLSNAQGSLDFLDSTLGDASDLVLEAKDIASGQVGATSDADTRRTQAVVVDGMIRRMLTIANSQTNGLYVFGGSTATVRPIEEMRNGFRYLGRGDGLRADLDPSDDIPITIGGQNAVGDVSGRLRSTTDLSPGLTADTRLTDVSGARGLGISRNAFSFSFNGGPATTIDISDADTAQDVADRITSALQQYEADNSVSILGPGGVSFSGGSLNIDMVGGQLVFSDIGSGSTAQDLGLSQAPIDAGNTSGLDLNPKLTLLTPLSALTGLTLPLESIRFRFTQGSGDTAESSIADVDLSSAQTLGDVQSLIQTSVPGVRMEIDSDGRGINIFNEISGPSLSIEEVSGGANTATELGIRSTSAATLLADFNSGRGVRIVDAQVDPVSGVLTRALNTDFRITLGSGQAFDVDLRPQDMVSVQTVIDRINEEFNTALSDPPLIGTAPALAAGDFAAGLSDGTNGLVFTQGAGVAGSGPLTIEKQNNSAAAQDLGLLNGSYDAGSASFTSQDRGAIQVDNLFTALLDLRDALRNDDSDGITLAGERLSAGVDRLAATRALVGVYANRVERSTQRQEDLQVFDEGTRSGLQDLDFSEASIRFSLLQTQLQAAMQSGVQTQNLSLLDFLG